MGVFMNLPIRYDLFVFDNHNGCFLVFYYFDYGEIDAILDPSVKVQEERIALVHG